MIVTAYNRPHYLYEAVKSVASQDLNRDDYEVLITKNFQDSKVESFASGLGFRVVDCGKIGAGGQIASALESTTGRLVALLDDDDTWSPSRLSHVSRWVQSRPNLEYYAHTYRPVDIEGRPDKGRTRDRRTHIAQLANEEIESVYPVLQTEETLDRLFRSYPGNNSSIVVSRRLMEATISDLRKVETSIDHFLLVAGLLESESMIIEHVPLTNWRVHLSNTSGVDTTSFPTFVESLKSRVATISRDNHVFLEMARQRGCLPLSSFLQSKVSLLDELEVLVNGERSREDWTRAAWTSARKVVGQAKSGFWAKALLETRVTSAFSSRLTEAVLFLYFQRLNSG